MSRIYCAIAFGILPLSEGCQSIKNGWLDPTVVGNYSNANVNEIRASLSLEDTPPGLPGAAFPSPEDLRVEVAEYPISGGDVLEVEIPELRQRQTAYFSQVQVSSAGHVNLPVIGRIPAVGLTPPELEEAIRRALIDGNVLVDPEVAVNPLFLQKATYSIFGIGVSAANNAPLRAGTFPIRRPDLRLLEAINQVGGLNEFVTEIYIFRYDDHLKPVAHRESNGHPRKKVAQRPQRAASLARFKSEDGQTPEPEDELIQAITAEQSLDTTPMQPSQRDIAQPIDADAPPPFVWVDGEFVPNPTYQGAGDNTTPLVAPSLETGPVNVNWSRIAGESNFRILHIPAESLRSGDPSWNIIVRPGDVIRIVSGEIGLYYVMGQVNRVGPFQFNAEQITLKAAIANAGGLSVLAWPDRCTVYRRLGQREQMIQVNLDRIFAGLDPDFIVKRGDIINVGTHPLAPFLARVRAMTLPNIPANVGYSFTYSRNYADIDSFGVRQNPHNEPDLFPRLFGNAQ